MWIDPAARAAAYQVLTGGAGDLDVTGVEYIRFHDEGTLYGIFMGDGTDGAFTVVNTATLLGFGSDWQRDAAGRRPCRHDRRWRRADSLSGGDGGGQHHRGTGADTLMGEVGDDTLIGGDGADNIIGGRATTAKADRRGYAGRVTGDDTLRGGATATRITRRRART